MECDKDRKLDEKPKPERLSRGRSILLKGGDEELTDGNLERMEQEQLGFSRLNAEKGGDGGGAISLEKSSKGPLDRDSP